MLMGERRVSVKKDTQTEGFGIKGRGTQRLEKLEKEPVKLETDIDFQSEEYFDGGRDSGAYRLWLTVTLSAANTYKESRGKDKQARSFLFDENPFIEGVCDQLGIEPDAIRERIQRDSVIKKIPF